MAPKQSHTSTDPNKNDRSSKILQRAGPTEKPIDGPTPLKSGLSSIKAHNFIKNIVDPQLKDDINRNMQGPLDVSDFVKTVLGFDEQDLRWKEWSFEPPTALYDEYARSGQEPARYEPFCAMLDDALKQWTDNTGSTRKRTIRLKPNTNGKKIKGYEGYEKPNERDPDLFSILPREDPTKIIIQWRGITIVAEFKKKGNRAADRLQALREAGPVSCPDPSFSAPRTSSRLKRKMQSVDEANKAQKTGRSSLPLSRINSQPIEPDVFSATGSTAAQDTPTPRATDDHIQLAGYANEMFASVGNRRYVTGIFVDDDKVSLWYYDRIGVVRSKEFSFYEDPKLFVLVAVAVAVCDRKHFGYEPLLVPEQNVVNPSTVDNSTLSLPVGHVVDGTGALVHEPVSFKVQDEPLYIQYGVVGRGTVVYSVKPKETGSLTFPEGKLVAKLSWPVKSRVAEDFLIRDIRTKIGPTWSKHIPELFCSMTLDEAALSLPRSLMGSLDGIPEERVLRLLITRHAHELKDVKSIEEFKAIFIRLVRCHRVVFVKARVLHRDLSVGNLMFLREGDEDPLALLNDWDLGKLLRAKKETRGSEGSSEESQGSEGSKEPEQSVESETPAARHRTGTAPFMALDLLRDKPPPHLYRHDLESFLYILIWCALHFNLNGSEVPGINGAVARWIYGSWEAIHDAKSAVISNVGDRQEKILDAITPAFRPLEQWIEGLFDMFEEGDRAVKDRNKRLRRGKLDAPGAWDEETAGGFITYEKFMTAIGESPDLDI